MKSFLFLACGLLLSAYVLAQGGIRTVTAGLRAPVGIEPDEAGNLWIAESGSGRNDGAVSVIWADGTTTRVIDSLPSFFDAMTHEVAGPQRVQLLAEDYLGVFSGEVPGPLGSSILVFERSRFGPTEAPLSAADAVQAIEVGKFATRAGFAESNPFSLVYTGCDMLIADAAANAVFRRDGLTGALSIFATFPPQPNPLPFGPPVIEAVPTRILHNPAGGYYISQLTGFPFLDGAARIFQVSEQGRVSVRDSNLTLVTDMAHHPAGDGLLVLQFAHFRRDSLPPFYFGSARLLHLRADGTRDTLARDFGPSPGLAVSEQGRIFVTDYFRGLVQEIDPSVTDVHTPDAGAAAGLLIYPNPSRGAIHLDFTLPRPAKLQLAIIDLAGRVLRRLPLGQFTAGRQHLRIDEQQFGGNKLPGQVYIFQVYGDTYRAAGAVRLE